MLVCEISFCLQLSFINITKVKYLLQHPLRVASDSICTGTLVLVLCPVFVQNTFTYAVVPSGLDLCLMVCKISTCYLFLLHFF